MNNLDYIDFSEAFYHFAYYAKRHNFHVNTINEMEKDVHEMDPFKHINFNKNTEVEENASK